MKKIICVLYILLPLLVLAQGKEEKKLAARVESLKVAMVDPTESSLLDLTMAQLTYGHSSGVIDTQADFVSKLVLGKSDFVSISISEQTIKIEKNTAIVRHKLDAITNDNGRPGEAHLWVMLVWVKKKGEWRLLARQAVKAT
ncbi:MAG: nuclear transport factor 2 family protein [Chitinophagaceae bacterium]|nr:nuclear transport factor 2 family protein [Chitinophagaceae bacterium]